MSLPDVVGDAVHDQVVPLVVLHLLHLDLDFLQLTPDTVLIPEATLHLAYLKMIISWFYLDVKAIMVF